MKRDHTKLNARNQKLP